MSLILHTISSLDPKSGGPSRSVPGLCNGLDYNNVNVSLAEINSFNDDGIKRQGWPSYIRSNIDQRAGIFLRSVIESAKPALVHDHGVWMLNNHMVVRETIQRRIPLVIAPRGMLEPWSLATKKWKKKLAMLLYQKRDLLSATALHATAEAEALQFRRLGFKQPIIISPNGVTLPQSMPERSRREDNKRVVLFVSRIHPKKGIIDLIEAWARLKRDAKSRNVIDSWHVELAGPDYNGHLEIVKNRINQLNVAEDFTYLGNLDDSEKWVAYRRADLFVLPTYSENFGIVVPEALAAGVPVITTKGAPWAEILGKCGNVEEVRECENAHALLSATQDAARMRECCGAGNAGAGITNELTNSRTNAAPCVAESEAWELPQTGRSGWWIDVGVEPLVQALQEATNLSDAERVQMGQAGRKLVENKYGWSSIAAEMGSAYEWILHGGEKPKCVKTD